MTDPFAKPQGWTILSWTAPEDGSISKDAFVTGGTLLIGLAPRDPTKPSTYNFAWLDASGQWHAFTGLRQVNAEGKAPSLEGGTVAPKWSVEMDVETGADSSTASRLHGKLISGFGEGNVGTFIAEAHPIGEGDPDHATG